MACQLSWGGNMVQILPPKTNLGSQLGMAFSQGMGNRMEQDRLQEAKKAEQESQAQSRLEQLLYQNELKKDLEEYKASLPPTDYQGLYLKSKEADQALRERELTQKSEHFKEDLKQKSFSPFTARQAEIDKAAENALKTTNTIAEARKLIRENPQETGQNIRNTLSAVFPKFAPLIMSPEASKLSFFSKELLGGGKEIFGSKPTEREIFTLQAASLMLGKSPEANLAVLDAFEDLAAIPLARQELYSQKLRDYQMKGKTPPPNMEAEVNREILEKKNAIFKRLENIVNKTDKGVYQKYIKTSDNNPIPDDELINTYRNEAFEKLGINKEEAKKLPPRERKKVMDKIVTYINSRLSKEGYSRLK